MESECAGQVERKEGGSAVIYCRDRIREEGGECDR